MTHHGDHHQAQVFGEDPALYDRFRPSYPRELMETAIAGTGESPVLEIGAGTGKATRALLALGKRVHALEPDARMAAALEQNCGVDRLTIDRSPIESALLPPAGFDLALAAQTWHWVDPSVAYERVAEALIPNGRIALLWHHPWPEQGLLGAAMKQIYSHLAPELPAVWPGTKGMDFDPANRPGPHRELFRNWIRHEHRWKRRLDGPSLIGWLCSSSDHRMMAVERRVDLMSAVASLVDDLGGEVTVSMTTVAHVAYRA